MIFSKLTKKVNTNNYIESFIELDLIKAQYNPDRFKFWQSLHKGLDNEVLNMLYSPHYKFLSGAKEDYYKMHKLYGRNNKWIKDKINKFTDLLDNIHINGYNKNSKIVVLTKPLVKNKYNAGLEVFEGHHRLTCCLFLGMKEIPCNIIGV